MNATTIPFLLLLLLLLVSPSFLLNFCESLPQPTPTQQDSKQPSFWEAFKSMFKQLIPSGNNDKKVSAQRLSANTASTDSKLGSQNRGGDLCNGSKIYCSTPLEKVTFIGTHNSYAVGTGPAANQHRSIIQQLNDGVRFINLDLHRSEQVEKEVLGSVVKLFSSLVNKDEANKSALKGTNVIRLCHGDCAVLDAGLFVDTMRDINQWLQAHPRDFVTIVFENVGRFTPRELDDAFVAAGVAAKTLMPARNKDQPWPTLGDALQRGQQLLVFMDYITHDSSVPWAMYEFHHVAETKFDVSTRGSFDCQRFRPANDDIGLYGMWMLNHYATEETTLFGKRISTTAASEAPRINSLASLTAQYNQCQQKPPTFVVVDFYELGDVFAFVNQVSLAIDLTLKPSVH